MEKSEQEVIGGTVPLNLPDNDCALPSSDGVCLIEPSEVKYYKKFLESLEEKSDHDPPKLAVEKIKDVLKVDTESEIWENTRFRKFVGADLADKILEDKFKPPGPAEGTALLDNHNIDDNLHQWSKYSKKLFGKKFYHVPFQMIDFADVQSELSNLDPGELMREKYDCFGVVMNTDVSSGPGKHWFCLYGDLARKGTKEDPIVLEYFNSSGNPPMDSVNVWLEDISHNMLKYHQKYCEITRSAPRRLQHSQTECGVWSLLYIRSRLEDHPPNWFYTVKADDRDMIETRKKLFRGD